MIVKLLKRPGGDKGFPAAVATGRQERNIGNLLGDGVNSAINPDDLLIGIGQDRSRWFILRTGKERGCAGPERTASDGTDDVFNLGIGHRLFQGPGGEGSCHKGKQKAESGQLNGRTKQRTKSRKQKWDWGRMVKWKYVEICGNTWNATLHPTRAPTSGRERAAY